MVDDLWSEAVRSIEPMVKPAHRDLWLRPITCLGIADGRIQLRAPNRYHKEWFEDNFLPSILKDLESRAHCAFTVDFEVTEEEADSSARTTSGMTAASVTFTAERPSLPPPPVTPAPDLVGRYTFD